LTDAAITLVEMALSELNQELTSLINQEGGRAVGLGGRYLVPAGEPFGVIVKVELAVTSPSELLAASKPSTE